MTLLEQWCSHSDYEKLSHPPYSPALSSLFLVITLSGSRCLTSHWSADPIRGLESRVDIRNCCSRSYIRRRPASTVRINLSCLASADSDTRCCCSVKDVRVGQKIPPGPAPINQRKDRSLRNSETISDPGRPPQVCCVTKWAAVCRCCW